MGIKVNYYTFSSVEASDIKGVIPIFREKKSIEGVVSPWYRVLISKLTSFGEKVSVSTFVNGFGGKIYSYEQFTLIIPTGGLTNLSSITINGQNCTDVNIISDKKVTAIAPFLIEGVYTMEIN